jgi:hypothetical protein
MSFAPGEPLGVHVATREESACRVDVYRVAGMIDGRFEPALKFVARSEPVEPLRYFPRSDELRLGPGDADVAGCGWPRVEAFSPIPDDWPSGLYLAQFTASPSPTGRASQRLGQDALFVVRPRVPGSRSRALFQIGVATWNAYHVWHNRTLYFGITAENPRVDDLRAHRVSFHRPGIGLNPPNGRYVSPYPPKAWSCLLPFLEWIEQERLPLEYCTGLDLLETISLDPYRLVLTVGHDEYWTARQRDVVESFVARGGNAAFFGGNLSYWQIRVSEDQTAIECYKRSLEHFQGLGKQGEPLDPLYRDPGRYPEHDNSQVTVQFFSEPVNRSTTSLTGVSMRNDGDEPGGRAGDPRFVFAGAAWWWEDVAGPERPAKGFTVCAPDHWAFAGTGLAYGDVFGEEQKIVGYECDGLDVERFEGRPVPTGRDGAAQGVEILAFADCRDWAEIDYSASPPTLTPGRMMNPGALGGVVTMVTFCTEGGGRVLTAPTTDWTHALVPTVDYTDYRSLSPRVRPASSAVQQITLNVLRRLGGIEPARGTM